MLLGLQPYPRFPQSIPSIQESQCEECQGRLERTRPTLCPFQPEKFLNTSFVLHELHGSMLKVPTSWALELCSLIPEVSHTFDKTLIFLSVRYSRYCYSSL